jgi:putative CRISPR-associated protein (TIGR02619 family)
MARTIITTCGTSLYTSSSWKDPDSFGGTALNRIKDRSDRHLYEGMYEAFVRRFEGRPTELAQQFEKRCWEEIDLLDKMPAELASLRSLACYFEKMNASLRDEDELIFYYSHDQDGQFCTNCIRQIIERFELVGSAQCIFESIEGLTPDNATDFGTALQALWSKCHERVHSKAGAHNIILNLTGGYKAMGIVLSALSSLMSGCAAGSLSSTCTRAPSQAPYIRSIMRTTIR